jgi:hypothetical protein
MKTVLMVAVVASEMEVIEEEATEITAQTEDIQDTSREEAITESVVLEVCSASTTAI